jgi:SAM-dependent methyltransferase
VSEPKDREASQLFIDENVGVHEGDEAAALLQRRNDARYYEPGRGVVRVDRGRWTDAQRYERKTWMELNLRASDDHNRKHLACFSGYEPLRGKRFRRGIELGCGPFTNLRLILGVAEVQDIHLLDPLVREYVRHPLCRYRGSRFGGLPRPGAVRRLMRAGQLREILDGLRIGGLRGRPVTLEASTVEDFETPHRFDLVVMINVIEHCRDLQLIFRTIERILEPGGTFVFNDRGWDPVALARSLDALYDAGHPLRVARPVLDEWLASRFDGVFRNDVAEDEEPTPGLRLSRTATYFIGQRKARGAT